MLEKQEGDAVGVDDRFATSAKVLSSTQTSVRKGLQEVPTATQQPFKHKLHSAGFAGIIYRMRANILVLNVGRIGNQRSRIILIKARLKKQ